MVAHVLRLRLALLAGAAHSGARDRGRSIAGLVLVVAGVVLAEAGLWALGAAGIVTVQTVTVIGGAAVAVGFLLAPPIASEADQLDPRRFLAFGVAGRPLAGATLVAGLASVPMLALLAVAVGVTVLWIRQGAGAAAVAGPVLGVATALLLLRISAAMSSWLLRERRSRELSGLFLLGLLVVVVPVGVFFASLDWGPSVPSALVVAVRVLSLTPFGAAWALPGYAAAGDGLGWVSLAVAIIGVLALTLCWYALVERILHSADRPVAIRTRRGMSWFAVMPASPGGAIAARSLLYWLRDRRYGVNVLVVPIAALLVPVPLLIAGVPSDLAALAPMVVIALFFGWLPHNDLAYDSTALWLHLASGVRGIADRAGRLVPMLVIGVPVLAVGIPIAVAVSGRWAHAPALVGACASLFLAGLGLSSISSAAAPYAVTRPGDSPFQQPQRTGGAGILAQALVLLGPVLLSLPTLWWGWLAVSGDASFSLVALAGGVVTGLLVLGIGLAIGSTLFERRGSVLMEFAETAA